jgi:multimeric flavodoxin WrbA
MARLDGADGIVFGCATYMGSGSAIYKSFLEAAFLPHWMEQRWKDKLAAGFTNSASQSGDKLSTLLQLMVFAMQIGHDLGGGRRPAGKQLERRLAKRLESPGNLGGSDGAKQCR